MCILHSSLAATAPLLHPRVHRVPSFLLLLFLCFLSSASPVLWLSTNAVQLTVPIGDDGQLMSGGPPVLWLSTNAVQLTAPIGDDGQLMSSPEARPSYGLVQTQYS